MLRGVTMSRGLAIWATRLALTAQPKFEEVSLRAVRAFKQGMAPIVIALLIATGWILAASHGNPLEDWHLWTVTVVTAMLVWRTKLHMLWLLGAGALLGVLGLI